MADSKIKRLVRYFFYLVFTALALVPTVAVGDLLIWEGWNITLAYLLWPLIILTAAVTTLLGRWAFGIEIGSNS